MFKNYILLALLIFTSILLNAQTIFINEIHYDNEGEDIDEGVEIAATAGLDLSCYEFHLYNGSNGSTYSMETLSGTVEDENDGFGFVWTAIEGIQNGGPDGIALYDKCTETLVQFLSYEGVMIAADGPIEGAGSTDIGVEETNTIESGSSLQLTGTGSNYEDFVWGPSQPATQGAINVGQSFGEGSTEMMVNILSNDATYSEDAGEIELSMQAVNVVTDFELKISFDGSSATLDYDFTASETVISVSADDGANQTLTATITIIDDEEEEEAETINITFNTDVYDIPFNKNGIDLIITDNDSPQTELPQYTIAEVTTENAEGVAESLDVECQLTGIVQGINLFDTGRLLFTIHDGTAGIGIFSNETDFGYTVTQGDEITVEGTIGQFNGLTQIAIDALTLVSSGNDLQAFKEVSVLDESTESENVFFKDLAIVDESQWIGDGSSFNVEFETYDGEAIFIRIDNNTPLSNVAFDDVFTPEAPFDIYGIGGQFDNESPYTEGYQLFPMKQDQIMQTAAATAQVNILGSDAAYGEDAGEIEIPIQAVNIEEDFDIIIFFGDGTATVDEDFTRSSEVIKVFAADGANQDFVTTIGIIDDDVEEDDETVVFNFELDNDNISLNKNSLTITIEDNDGPVVQLPQYTIAEVTTENAEGVADSLDVQCRLTGVVQGINLFDAGRLLFTMHDGSAGISVFNNDTDFGYTVTPGDEITVEGTIGQFNGLTQIGAETIEVLSSDNALLTHRQVSTLDESTESEPVFLIDLTIVDESQWLGDGSSFNVDFETPGGEIIVVRIDNNTPLANLSLSDFGQGDGLFEILGIGGQFDGESPFDEGYQLFPMRFVDIIQITPNIEEIILGKDVNILQIGNAGFRIESIFPFQNLKTFEMNGKAVSIIQNENEFFLNDAAKGLYLITFEIDGQVYSAKISLN